MASTFANSEGMLPTGRSAGGRRSGGSNARGMSWTMTGIEELRAKLYAMGKGGKLASETRIALRAGMVGVKKEAEQNIVESPGMMGDTYHIETYAGHWSYRHRWLMPGYAKRHIKIASFVSRDKTGAKVIVGPDKDAFYASQFLEYGFPSRGYPKQAWLKPAFESNRGRMLQLMISKMGKRLRILAHSKGSVA